MKKNVFLLGLLLSFYGNAQISLQTYAGNKETEVLGIYDKDFGSKWNYFASGTIGYDYDLKKISPELYQNINYGIGRNLGVSAGVHISEQDIMPSIGLAYGKANDVFGISVFPALTYSTDAKELGLGLYTLMEYTRKINERLNFYSMLIIESDFSFKEHQASNQIIRLGLENRKKLQFGIGSNISQTGSHYDTDINFGIFIGKKF
ncbi:hypothetical protein [Chryseobacterium sp.]|uniref:hypothetical protein n=1 Tax=Chryseobacterium sp. TaxID=1871047 RepID=UPI00321B57B3